MYISDNIIVFTRHTASIDTSSLTHKWYVSFSPINSRLQEKIIEREFISCDEIRGCYRVNDIRVSVYFSCSLARRHKHDRKREASFVTFLLSG